MKEHSMNESTAHSVVTRALAAALATALPAAAGCSLLERPEAGGAQYMMALPAQQPVEGGKLGTVMVARFSAIPPFDARPFLYRTSDGTWRLDAYNGFMSDPSDMLCEGFARALERSGRFTMVGIEGISVRCDVTLDGIIEGFYADYSDKGAPAAIVEVRAYLLDGRGSRTRLVAQMMGRGRAPISGADPSDVAAAFSAATGEAIDAVVRALPAEMAPMPEMPGNSAARARPRGETGRGSEDFALQPQKDD
jgi:ABC-type uncharacterized transport system auxiliary subunit